MAKTPVTGYEPDVTDTSDDFAFIPSFFEGSNEVDDEHIRNALALPLFSQESEAEASLGQTYHYNEEGLFKDAQSILARTGQPVARLTQKRKSRQELDDGQIRIILEGQMEQMLAGAKSDILEEYKADLAENDIRESQVLENGYSIAGYEQSRLEESLLQEEQAD